MRKITIIGGGQCGLQIGLSLLHHDYHVTIVTNRTAEEIRTGKVLSSQAMLNDALQHERDAGINFWESECPPIEGVDFSVGTPEGGRTIHWETRLDAYGQSVDQRVKIPGWMARFEASGGHLRIEDAGIEELERYAEESDLVIVASGKGEIAGLFERDEEKSAFSRPMRALALTYSHNMLPREEFSAVCFNVVPGVGEYFVFPALTTTGTCDIMVYEGIPGGPMDECWRDVRSAADHVTASKWVVDTFFPWESHRCRNIELTDDNGRLIGRFPPIVRKPVATLPSGRAVMGVADVVVLNDPLTGQGSNNASKCARLIYEAVLEQGDGPFDARWMQATFDSYWDYARWVVKWTNALLLPPEEPILTVLGAAMTYPELAREIGNSFNNPRRFEPWFYDPAAAREKLNRLAEPTTARSATSS